MMIIMIDNYNNDKAQIIHVNDAHKILFFVIKK